ncbi:hypothetical protein A3715_10385 [Oleiphilus sp. HI0009]|nr:hypothetical protein A3715_10385 [Oleiphilus sp. HI0009]
MRFEAEKGERLHRYFWGVTTNTPERLWWNQDLKKWEEYPTKNCNYSTHAPCRTLRAFKRMLRKNPELKGRCVLVNKYKGFDVYG